jgi:hypothetical protein
MGQTGAKNTLQRGDPYRTPFLVSLPSRRKMEQLRRRPKWFARSHLPPPKRADVLPHLHPSPSFYGGAAATAEATMPEKAVDDVMEAVVGAHFSDLRIKALRLSSPSALSYPSSDAVKGGGGEVLFAEREVEIA